MADVIDIDDLVVAYGAKTAIDHLTLRVGAGSLTALVGANGAGKSSLLEVCQGSRAATAGSARIFGLDPIRDRRSLLPRVGVHLQRGGVWSDARAIEMLRHIAALHAHPLPIGNLVERLGLGSCGNTPYRRLSGGQQQRLALAMAIVGRPELLLADEPTAGMDPVVRRETWQLLRELHADGVTVVLTTHHLDEAEKLADPVFMLDRGRLVASGSPQALVAQWSPDGGTLEDAFFAVTATRERQ
ncbi:MAG: ABC transporter ATP-binding protein [Nocardioides sp.]